MAGLKDFLFGSGTLKKAATGPGPSTPKTAYQAAGLDMAKLAQDSADRSKSESATAPPSTKRSQPLSSPMSGMGPVKKAGK